MLASLLIVFREVLEAGLIVSVVLAAIKEIPRRGHWTIGGITVGVLCAMLVIPFAEELKEGFFGIGKDLSNAIILLIAVPMLVWHQYWMASYGQRMIGVVRAMGRDVELGRRSLLAISIVVAVAVFREGAEAVLFLYGVAVSGGENWTILLLWGLLGACLGLLVSTLFYQGLVAVPVGQLFVVTGWLIALLAAGMADQAAAMLVHAHLLLPWGDQLWDTSWLLTERSTPGRALRTLLGYSDRPMGVQLVAWIVVFGVISSARMTGLQHAVTHRRS